MMLLLESGLKIMLEIQLKIGLMTLSNELVGKVVSAAQDQTDSMKSWDDSSIPSCKSWSRG